MTIVANTYDMRTIPSAGKDWHEFLQTENARFTEEIKAAESGYSHYITKLAIRINAVTMDVSVGSGETGNVITTVHFGPIPLRGLEVSGFFEWHAPRGKGVKCTSGLSVTISSSVAGTLSVEAHGKTCKD